MSISLSIDRDAHLLEFEVVKPTPLCTTDTLDKDFNTEAMVDEQAKPESWRLRVGYEHVTTRGDAIPGPLLKITLYSAATITSKLLRCRARYSVPFEFSQRFLVSSTSFIYIPLSQRSYLCQHRLLRFLLIELTADIQLPCQLCQVVSQHTFNGFGLWGGGFSFSLDCACFFTSPITFSDLAL